MPLRKNAGRPAVDGPHITTIIATDSRIGPFINARPRLIPGQRYMMGLNVFAGESVTIRLASSDPAVVSVPAEVESAPEYGSVMFEIAAHSVGNATITATLGDESVTTPAKVGEDKTEIESLVGLSPNGPAGQFVYELGSAGAEIAINVSGPVVHERIATITSSTPEVATVPESVVIPGDTNWPQSFPLELHAVGTSLITVSSHGVTLQTMIEVIVPVLWIASIKLNPPRASAGEDIEVTVTMTDDAVRDIAITIEATDQVQTPTGLVIPRGKRSGTFLVRVLENLDGTRPMGIRWLHSLHLVGLYS